jgi:AcrR family transcriptional regulator
MPPGRRERKKLELRERIVDTARTLIATQGLAQTTVDQIADSCDIAQATFFNYFASKGALLDALVQRLTEQFNEVLEGVPGEQGPAAEAGVSRIDLLFRFTAALTPEEQRVVRDILAESARAWTPTTLEGMSRTRDLFIADIAAHQGGGTMRTDRSAESLADAALGLYFSVLLFWDVDGGGSLADRLDATRQLVADLLAGPGSVPGGSA